MGACDHHPATGPKIPGGFAASVHRIVIVHDGGMKSSEQSDSIPSARTPSSWVTLATCSQYRKRTSSEQVCPSKGSKFHRVA